MIMQHSDWHLIFRQLRERFLSSTEPDLLGLRKIAKEQSILPLVIDMSGFFGINDKREIFSFSFENLTEPIIENDNRIFNIVVFRGSETYPELKPFIPLRPVDGLECPYCLGTGIAPDQSTEINNLVCYCGGLGWIPKGSEALRSRNY